MTKKLMPLLQRQGDNCAPTNSAPTTKSNESAGNQSYYIKLAAQSLFSIVAGFSALYGLAQLLVMGGVA